MKFYSFYHKETGIFDPSCYATDHEESVPHNTPADHIAVEGEHDYLCRRMDLATNTVVPYQPPQPSADHVWHEELQRWVLSEAVAARLERHRTALDTIRALEHSQHRVLRELALGDTKAMARLRDLDAQIAKLRGDLSGA